MQYAQVKMDGAIYAEAQNAKRVSAVQSELNALDHSLAELSEAIENIKRRVEPVCSPIPPVAGVTGSANPSSGVPLAEEIGSHARRVKGAVSALNELLARIEI